MNKAVIFFIIASSVHGADIERLIPALIKVESRGNNLAIGDNGKAYGCLQIHQEVLDDVNKKYGTHYVLKDCFVRPTAINICKNYLLMWARVKSTEQNARIWNGGPRGDRKIKTIKYWEKVKHEIDNP
jgi:hypothetical protein